MTRIVITGGPKTGKTTLAMTMPQPHDETGPCIVRHTDDLIPLGWSEASQAAALWFDAPGPWIIEGVAVSRALRKWRDQHPGEPPPVDRVIMLTQPHQPLTPGQQSMTKGVDKVHDEIVGWLESNGVRVEYIPSAEHPGYNGRATL